ncbi:hypothetical protein GCM10023187_37440 [Nibrella viscosa]|uniref:AlgX/AlgJ SGNH hydrolase-like domain-containing protein n=1 Tax=Nibrella viscosa TaxID=1084524 RepID=A0ABP8KPQ6_9BACT
MRNILKIAISYGILAIVTVLICEIGLRVYNFFYPSPIFYDTSYNRYRGKPHEMYFRHRLNVHGYNDTEFSVNQDKFRIVGLGDSFAFGVVPYAYNYLTQLEQKLPGVEVYNMGIPSINPENYYSVLTKEGMLLNPNLVLVSFFIGNDFEIPVRRRYTYSYTITLLNYLYSMQGKISSGPGSPDMYCDTCASFKKKDYLEIERNRVDFFSGYVHKNDFSKYAAQSFAALVNIRDWCQENNAKLVVVLLPDEAQVSRGLQEEIRTMYFSDQKELPHDLTFGNRWLHEQLTNAGIAYIDLLEPFRQAALHQTLYKPYDSHWNIAGNTLAAQVLTDSLQKYINAPIPIKPVTY